MTGKAIGSKARRQPVIGRGIAGNATDVRGLDEFARNIDGAGDVTGGIAFGGADVDEDDVVDVLDLVQFDIGTKLAISLLQSGGESKSRGGEGKAGGQGSQNGKGLQLHGKVSGVEPSQAIS